MVINGKCPCASKNEHPFFHNPQIIQLVYLNYHVGHNNLVSQLALKVQARAGHVTVGSLLNNPKKPRIDKSDLKKLPGNHIWQQNLLLVGKQIVLD